MSERSHDVHVLSFYGNGELLEELKETGARFWTAEKRGRWNMAGFLVRLVRELRRIRPDVVYSSMPAANIASTLVYPLVGKPDTVWRLAASEMDLSRYHWFSALSYKVEAMLASRPGAIVANSFAGREAAVRRGFPAGNLNVIVNGIRTDIFASREQLGEALKRSWGLDERKWIVGQVARSDPKKGYEDFLSAAKMLCERRADVQFVCIGVDPGEYAARLKETARQMGIADRVIWRGIEDDMVSVYNVLDINTLSSRFGEGVPNSIGEAMACGVPCVVTDVGDSGKIVGETGEVVAPGSPEQLVQGWTRLLSRLESNRVEIGRKARERIVENFSVDSYIDKTEELLLSFR